MSAASLLSRLEQTASTVVDAKAKLCGSLAEYTEAKRRLELEEARLTCQGIDGKNEAQRAAKLRLELEGLHQALHEAEDLLSEAKCQVEMAEVKWQLARYCVRVLELPA